MLTEEMKKKLIKQAKESMRAKKNWWVWILIWKNYWEFNRKLKQIWKYESVINREVKIRKSNERLRYFFSF